MRERKQPRHSEIEYVCGEMGEVIGRKIFAFFLRFKFICDS